MSDMRVTHPAGRRGGGVKDWLENCQSMLTDASVREKWEWKMGSVAWQSYKAAEESIRQEY